MVRARGRADAGAGRVTAAPIRKVRAHGRADANAGRITADAEEAARSHASMTFTIPVLSPVPDADSKVYSFIQYQH